MKITTPKFLLISLALILVFTLASSFKTGQNGHKFATMTIYEIPSGGIWDSKIIIVYEDSKSEEIPLQRMNPRNWTTNKIKITETLNSMSTKGYELVSTDNSTYIFQKK